MQPFNTPVFFAQLTSPYPEAKDILSAAYQGEKKDLEAICRLWLSEGIPYAFRSKPILYEVIRVWIASQLSIHPKELTLIGSARQGSSVSPPPKAGKPFNFKSDLDWSAVSKSLFIRFRNEFKSWEADYANRHVHPRDSKEKRCWDDNVIHCNKTLSRGFIDAKYVPTFDKYPLSKCIGNAMWLVHEKCQLTIEAPAFRKSSVRIYRDWGCFIKQLALSLDYSCKKYTA